MSEPAIVPPVVFGSNAPGGVGVVGSLAAGTPTLTNNPATAASLAAFQNGFGSICKNLYPALQDLDGINFYITSQIAGIIGQGISGWFSSISYNQNAFVSYNGFIYLSLQNANLNNTPSVGSTFWQSLGSSAKGTNVVSNSGMQVNQYGTSGTITTSSAFTLDRWTVSCPTGTINWSQVYANTIGNCLQLTASGTTALVQLRQKIESLISQQIQSTGVGANCIIQAYIFNNTSSPITPVLSVLLPTAQDNYTSTVALVNAQNLQTIPANSGAVVAYNFSFTNSNNSQNGLEIIFNFGSQIATGTNVQIGMVDLSSCPTYASGGLVSNPPAPTVRRYSEELIHCQRYYQTWNQTTAPIFANGIGQGSTATFFNLTFLETMRIAPSLNTSGSIQVEDGTNTWAVTGISLIGTGTQATGISVNNNATTVEFHPYFLSTPSTYSFNLNAEIG